MVWLRRKWAWLLAGGLLLVIGVAVLAALGGSRLERNIASCQLDVMAVAKPDTPVLDQAKQVSACLVQKNGPLERWRNRRSAEAIAALPYVPCRYLGVWVSMRERSAYTITLKGTGEFIADPLTDSNRQERYTGSWGVYEGQMVWLPRSNRGVIWPPDINRIRDPKAESFSLEEADGKLTHFFLVKSLFSRDCSA